MPGNGHGGCGRRLGETHRRKHRQGAPGRPDRRLTGREREVLAEIALGHTTDEVAELLSIMPTTVKSYLKNVMGKLGTRNRVETLRAARRAGLVS